ncbi:MAG TPA: hypothetical protein HPP80_10960 [Rhodospirillaceae bacterium]|nr:hypothetical protein [Rhodospirillaceae bacterium]
MKFIIISDPEGNEYPFIFPPKWGHNEMAAKMVEPHQTVVAAGFIRTNDVGQFECYGRSSSLNIPSRPQWDTALVKRLLAVT